MASPNSTPDAERAPRRGEPKYYIVKRFLLVQLDALGPGAVLPTERELAASLQTSRTTVRQALMELVNEGRLIRRQGAGTVVAEPKLTWPLGLESFTEQISAQGMRAAASVLGTERLAAGPELGEMFGLRADAPLYRIDRLRLADLNPIALESSWLDAERFTGLTRLVRAADSLHELLASRFGAVVEHARASIQTTPATPREARPLGIDVGTPMLVVERVNYDERGCLVELGRTWFRGDRLTLTVPLDPRAPVSRTSARRPVA